jgi:hypothetical protein
MYIASLFSIFHRQLPWPNPEASVGRICEEKVGGQTLYEAKGPVCHLFNNEIGPAIGRLLNDHKEDLERCECRPQHMGVYVRMIGSEPYRTQPVIIIASLGAKQRKKAKQLIQQYRILARYPEILLKTLEELPAIPKGKHHTSMISQIISTTEKIRIVGSPLSPCGAKLMVGPSAQATLGGVITLSRKFYGWTAAHPGLSINLPQDLVDISGELAFDDDSDYCEDQSDDDSMREVLFSASFA